MNNDNVFKTLVTKFIPNLEEEYFGFNTNTRLIKFKKKYERNLFNWWEFLDKIRPVMICQEITDAIFNSTHMNFEHDILLKGYIGKIMKHNYYLKYRCVLENNYIIKYSWLDKFEDNKTKYYLAIALHKG